MVGEAGERKGWLSRESLMHSRVKMLRSKREVVSVAQMRKEAKKTRRLGVWGASTSSAKLLGYSRKRLQGW